MEIHAEKTKLMTNNSNGILSGIEVNGQALDTVSNFKYLGAIVSDEGSKWEVHARIAQTTAALAKLRPIWKNNISLASKVRLLRSLVTSIFLYTCETWTLTAELQKRVQSMEMRCYRRLLGISYTQHVTNEEVRQKIRQAIGPHDDLLSTVIKRKLRWYGHITRSSGLAKTILQGTIPGGRRRGRQKKRWEDNIAEWTHLKLSEAMRTAEDREGWRELVSRSSVVPQRPSRVTDRAEPRQIIIIYLFFIFCSLQAQLWKFFWNTSPSVIILHNKTFPHHRGQH